ncbi:hypothetical protein, partial [Mycolicibacter heraklionensis]|uniref:hypothetical protein n=1 Tax=Mycolicibacter heraklionensis TaxID=512402 RepID=UPI001A95B634
MAFRRHSLSTSIAHLHGDERTDGHQHGAGGTEQAGSPQCDQLSGIKRGADGALVAVQVRDRRAQRMPAEGHPSSV